MTAPHHGGTEPSGPRPYLRRPGPGGHPENAPQTSAVRPYLITGGRTGPIDATLRLEAQILATHDGLASRDRMSYERRDILTIAQRPLAIAELAAHLGLHLGVTRVLVGDLIAMGLLAVRQPANGRHPQHVLERVIRGLQNIA